MTTKPTVEEIKQIIFQLPIQEQIILKKELEERLETLEIMQLSETGFTEWNDEEEDIYHE
ncbi:MAG: hypothetical protein Tsb0014_47870 [Pleurocapsa sp.]